MTLRQRLDAVLATGKITPVQADQLTERLLPAHQKGQGRCVSCWGTSSWPCPTARLILRANTNSGDGWHTVLPTILDAHPPERRLRSCAICQELWPCDTVRIIAQVLGEQWNWEPLEATDDDDDQGHVLGVLTEKPTERPAP